MLRNEFYGKYTEEFFHTFQEPEPLNYACYGVAPLSSTFFNQVSSVSKVMFQILEKVRDYVLTQPEQLEHLGFSEKMIPYLNETHLRYDTIASRFDVIRNGDSFKFIELNNDTPFLILENFKMNEELTFNLGLDQELDGKEKLFRQGMLDIVTDSADYLGKKVHDILYAVVSHSEEDDLEDYLTAKYYFTHLNSMVKNAVHIPFSELLVDRDTGEVSTADGFVIDVLFKPSYPYEFLTEDTYADGSGSIGIDLIELYKEKKVALVTPPRAHVMQNKSLFALVTFLYDSFEDFFTEAEESVIEKHVPKTYFDESAFEAEGKPYVVKPVIGREGQSVVIVNAGESAQSKLNNYDNELMIYQEFLEAPHRRVVVEDEYVDLVEVLGVFMVNGSYAGTVIRLGDSITEWDCHWVAAYKTT